MKNKNINKGNGTQLIIEKNSGIIFNGTNDNSPKQDNSFWDKILKLPTSLKIILLTALILILILVFVLLNKGFTIETPIIKVIPPHKDSVSLTDNKSYKTVSQTQIEPKKNNVMDLFKKKNTDKTTNINSGSGTQINIEKNEGIVANNSTININTDLPPRSLNDPSAKKELDNFLAQFMKEHNRDKSCAIKVRVDHTSQEARDYAKEIYDYLKGQHYNVQGVVNLEIFSPEIQQTEVFYEKNQLYEDTDSTIHIKVGLNKQRLKKN